MWLLNVLEMTCMFSLDIFNIAVPVVDAGIQVWNGITINEMVFVKNQEWSGDLILTETQVALAATRKRRDIFCETKNCTAGIHADNKTFDPNKKDSEVYSDLNDDFLNVKKSFFSIYITENLSFDFTLETVLSIAIVQFPALCLACFGIFVALRKHGLSFTAGKHAFHASFLMFWPFCFVELFAFESDLKGQIVMEKLKCFLDCLSGCCSERCVQWFDFLHFLRKNEESNQKDKMLSVEVIKVLFGTCLQFCLQMILCVGYTKQEEIEYSQVFSILSSFLVICKLGVDIVRFKRKAIEDNTSEETEDNTETEEGSCWEHIKTNLNETVKKAKRVNLKTFFFYLFLLLTSVASNVGTLIMTILVWNEYAAIYISVVFALNLIVSIILPFGFVELCEQKLRIKFKYDRKKEEEEEAKNKVMKPCSRRVWRGIFVSWSNIFFISRPVEDSSYFRTIHMVLMQILRFPLNLATLIGLLTYTTQFSPFAESLKSKLVKWTIGLVVIEIVNIAFVFRYTYRIQKERIGSTGSEESIPLVQSNNDVSVSKDAEVTVVIIDNNKSISENGEKTVVTILNESSISEEDEITDTENMSMAPQLSPIQMANNNFNTRETSVQETCSTHSDDENEESKQITSYKKATCLSIKENDLERIADQFNLTNTVDKKELKDLLKNGLKKGFKKEALDEVLKYHSNKESLKKHIIDVFDKNKDGVIEPDQFILVILTLLSGTPEELFENIFKLIDKSNEGKISKDMFKSVVSDIFVLVNETKLTDPNIEQLVGSVFADIDKELDGKVVRKQFIKACKEHNYIVVSYIREFISKYNTGGRRKLKHLISSP